MAILFDFDQPLSRTCQKCGYPFGNPPGMKLYPMKEIDCPEHMPPHWKFHEREALKVAKAVDRAEALMKEIAND